MRAGTFCTSATDISSAFSLTAPNAAHSRPRASTNDSQESFMRHLSQRLRLSDILHDQAPQHTLDDFLGRHPVGAFLDPPLELVDQTLAIVGLRDDLLAQCREHRRFVAR